jgi:ABC-2 type transport system ATP-binding protein
MITTKHLSKRYGEILAVDDLTFAVAPGEVLGFLGANGAGKSTTMRMIAGFISPTAGQVTVCGHDIESAPVAAKACMGYLPRGRAQLRRNDRGRISRFRRRHSRLDR